jgi:hypothetical protein
MIPSLRCYKIYNFLTFLSLRIIKNSLKYIDKKLYTFYQNKSSNYSATFESIEFLRAFFYGL